MLMLVHFLCARSMVIICASLDEFDAQETIQALRFGEQCQRVKNEATVGQSHVTSMIEKLDERIADLESVIKAKEQWVAQEVRRVDENVEDGTYEATLAAKSGGETVRTFKAVGAESERDELVKLLKKRAKLSGEVRTQ